MKRIALFILLMSTRFLAFSQQPEEKDSFYLLSPVEVRAIRAGGNSPFTVTNLTKQQIAKSNLGQDLPFLLNQTASVVVNSDAGTGIGYTGIRIRGTDATRINVTLNGIPYNDAESQITYFVDLPDFASSTGSIQVQRGVGTSSNGAGSFGASINLSTNEAKLVPYTEFNNSGGSFNTLKNTLLIGSGLIHNHLTLDLALSRIASDGYIDRAASNLRSIHFSTAYYWKTSSLRLNVFLGKEKTYQAWYGVSQADLDAGRRRINPAGTEKPGDPYPDETDNYWQNHFQLFYDRLLGKHVHVNAALFYTKGKGYYEEYRAAQDYSIYDLPYPMNGNTPILTSDFIRRLWLNNDFYGNIFSLQYKTDKEEATFGGGYNHYAGDHYGKLIWASNGITGPAKWYNVNAEKNDVNLYLKEQRRFAGNWYYFLDAQFRHVGYHINGFEDNPGLVTGARYNFFNPKAGISYLNDGWKLYTSLSIANKEPNRDDFESNHDQRPRPECLHDWETGIEKRSTGSFWGVTFFYMNYKDQLALTGKINDVGSYTRTNIPKSYRLGIEIQGEKKLSAKFTVSGNLAISKNKVIDFVEFIDDYDNGGQQVRNYDKTDLALSPRVVGGYTITVLPVRRLECSLLGKYVSRQYLDNTQHNDRSLNTYYLQDFRVIYTLQKRSPIEPSVIVQVNNIWNRKYEPNGYTYNYFEGGFVVVNNYYFPMAGTNFMVGLNMKF